MILLYRRLDSVHSVRRGHLRRRHLFTKKNISKFRSFVWPSSIQVRRVAIPVSNSPHLSHVRPVFSRPFPTQTRHAQAQGCAFIPFSILEYFKPTYLPDVSGFRIVSFLWPFGYECFEFLCRAAASCFVNLILCSSTNNLCIVYLCERCVICDLSCVSRSSLAVNKYAL